MLVVDGDFARNSEKPEPADLGFWLGQFRGEDKAPAVQLGKFPPYPVPTSVPDGYTASFTFPATAKNPILKLPANINYIFGYEEDFQTDSASEIKTYNSTLAPNVSPDSTVLLVCDQVSNPYANLGVLYAITPSVGIGSLITDRPSFPIYSSLKAGTFSQDRKSTV